LSYASELDWEKTSGHNAASDSAKDSYVEVQKISLETEQIASDVGTFAYGWALILEQTSRRRTSRYFFVEFL